MLIAPVQSDHFDLLRKVFVATLHDAAARMGKGPPADDEVDLRIEKRSEDGWLALVISVFGYETTVEWDGTLGDAVKQIVDTAATRAFDFDR